ncbi:MAG: phosphate acyltransferase PlsX [Chloroflexota bacterium]
MRIVLDAMGSDTCPVPDVDGAVQAARASGDTIILVGDQAAIERELAKYDTKGLSLEVVHASQTVDMHDKPSQVARAKPDSSMMVGLMLVKNGKADAFVTAGNTGAALALATLSTLRRVRGVKRPALTALIRLGQKTVVLTDLGANADAKPEWLVQFGEMASIYAERVMGQKNPTIGVLSNGEEEGKGNALVKDTTLLFEQSGLNFIGNIEPKDMLQGVADVVVADGFVGNIALKSMESLAEVLFSLIRTELTASLWMKIGAAIVYPALRRVYRQVDPFEIGGAPLLGVNGVVIIGHGRTNAKGIKNAIFQAQRAVNGKFIEAIQSGMARFADESHESHESHDAAE